MNIRIMQELSETRLKISKKASISQYLICRFKIRIADQKLLNLAKRPTILEF